MVSLMGTTYLHLPVNTCRVFTLQSLHLLSTFKCCIFDSLSKRQEGLETVLWLVSHSTHLWTNEITFTQSTCPDAWGPPSPKLNQRCYLQFNLSLSLLERPGNWLATHLFAFEIISSASFSLSPLFFLLFPVTVYVDYLLWVAAMGRLLSL